MQKSNDTAIEVKFADLRHNSDTTRFPLDEQKASEKNKKEYSDRMNMLVKIINDNQRVKALIPKDTYNYIMDRGTKFGSS
ncbi:MAG: hypothetical protein FWC26_12725 [Fibromonadales bacterium]|nr:hypothetical protein [Fibromonadales bacterium]